MDEPEDAQPQEEPNVRKLIRARSLQRKLAKQAFDPKNIPQLRATYKMHIKAAAEIRKLLKQIGASVKADCETSSSE